MGVMVDARESALFISPHIVENTTRVLSKVLQWDESRVRQFVNFLAKTVVNSGGDVVDPPRQVHDCTDFEDNHILDLAVEVGALLVVSDDSYLTSMSPWRGTPILRPREFASRVDGMRRHRRPRRRSQL
jgi:predicted nucleic acid-binding protein